jgi:DNA-binding SARP family transcriptional activator
MPIDQGVRERGDDRDDVRLRLLGTFALMIGPDDVALPPTAQRLLAYLALERRWAARPATATTLWPTVSAQRASGNLRSTLWRITRTVGRVIVTTHPHGLRLEDDVDIDYLRAERSARECGELTAPSSDHLDTDPFSVDLLPDWCDEWVEVQRECFRQVRLRALEALSAHNRRTGRLGEALDAALTAVAADPLRESAHRQLVEVHLADGNAAEAVRQYHFYRQILSTRLGLAPSPVMRQLVAPLLACPARPVSH